MINKQTIYSFFQSKPRNFWLAFFVLIFITLSILTYTAITILNHNAVASPPDQRSAPESTRDSPGQSAHVPETSLPSETKPASQTTSKTELQETAKKSNADSREFIDTTLGISFNYAPQSGGAIWEPTVSDRKVYMLDQKHPEQTGRYLEVFDIEPANTIEEAINKNILNSYDKANCRLNIVQTNSSSSVKKAVISYPEDNLPSGYFLPIDPTKCPADYTPINWIGYFYFNTQHPSKLIYFNIGQDNIPASLDPNLKGVGYDSTIKIL